jgi:hypothetical protein
MPIPWEVPAQPPVEALLETVKLFLTDAERAFSRMPRAGDISRPLLYALLVGSIGPIAAQIYSFVLPNPFARWIQEQMGQDVSGASALGGILGIFIVPVAVAIGIFVGAGILHFCLYLVGGANEGFVTSLRVVCYASTGQLAQLIPVVGGFIAFGFVLFLEIKGLTIAHRTTSGKAVAAVLIPVAFCCVCVTAVALLAGAALISMFKG